MAMRQLVLITSGFPYGKNEAFLEAELPMLCAHFEKVIIFCPSSKEAMRAIPANCSVEHIAHQWDMQGANLFKILRKAIFWQEVNRIFKNLKLKFILNAIRIAVKDLNDAYCFANAVEKLKVHKADDTLFYTYWTDYKTLACAILKQRKSIAAFVNRYHRWDLYFETHPVPYLPFRNFISKSSNRQFFISSHGKAYMENSLWIVPGTLSSEIARLGTKPLAKQESPKQHGLEKIVLVSVSALIERKRVALIKEAVLSLDLPVEWNHFGTGIQHDLFQDLSEIEKLKIHWHGAVSNSDLHQWFSSHKVDLFINVSSSEGVPVSIMEALSYGIPVIASAVDGNPEIVEHNHNGFLLSEYPDLKELADAILNYYHSKSEIKEQLKLNAYNSWQKNYNATLNFTKFALTLKTITNEKI